MLSSVLKSPRAISVNVAIMRAFVRLRDMALTHAELSRKIEDLERKYEGRFAMVFNALRQLTRPSVVPEPPRRRIGFVGDDGSEHRSSRARR